MQKQLVVACFLFGLSSLPGTSLAASDQVIFDTHPPKDMPCIECHAEDQPHDGNFGKDCSLCHQPDTWEELGFDHGLSRFPLIGIHTELDCETCHSEQPALAGVRQCVDCHREDDAHNQFFGDTCSRCHNPSGWQYWQFDHDVQTDFPLVGQHSGLVCSACHQAPLDESEIGLNCVDCHRQDNPHRGDFGFNCERCHQPTDFKDLKMSNNKGHKRS